MLSDEFISLRNSLNALTTAVEEFLTQNYPSPTWQTLSPENETHETAKAKLHALIGGEEQIKNQDIYYKTETTETSAYFYVRQDREDRVRALVCSYSLYLHLKEVQQQFKPFALHFARAEIKAVTQLTEDRQYYTDYCQLREAAKAILQNRSPHTRDIKATATGLQHLLDLLGEWQDYRADIPLDLKKTQHMLSYCAEFVTEIESKRKAAAQSPINQVTEVTSKQVSKGWKALASRLNNNSHFQNVAAACALAANSASAQAAAIKDRFPLVKPPIAITFQTQLLEFYNSLTQQAAQDYTHSQNSEDSTAALITKLKVKLPTATDIINTIEEKKENKHTLLQGKKGLTLLPLYLHAHHLVTTYAHAAKDYNYAGAGYRKGLTLLYLIQDATQKDEIKPEALKSITDQYLKETFASTKHHAEITIMDHRPRYWCSCLYNFFITPTSARRVKEWQKALQTTASANPVPQ